MKEVDTVLGFEGDIVPLTTYALFLWFMILFIFLVTT
jgi:hypothetical protein